MVRQIEHSIIPCGEFWRVVAFKKPPYFMAQKSNNYLKNSGDVCDSCLLIRCRQDKVRLGMVDAWQLQGLVLMISQWEVDRYPVSLCRASRMLFHITTCHHPPGDSPVIRRCVLAAARPILTRGLLTGCLSPPAVYSTLKFCCYGCCRVEV